MKESILTESLKCILTDKEKLELGDKQARDFAELGRLEDKLKEVGSQIKSQIKEVEARLKSTSETVRNGYLYRDVEVLKVIDGEIVKFFRRDTGECYNERGIMLHERQMVLEVKKASATETIENAQRKEPIEPLAESAKEPEAEGKKESPAMPYAQELEPGARQETDPESAEVSSDAGLAEDPDNELDEFFGRSDFYPDGTPRPKFDKDAQEFLDQASPLQRAVITEPVKTRAQILAEPPITPVERAAAQGVDTRKEHGPGRKTEG